MTRRAHHRPDKLGPSNASKTRVSKSFEFTLLRFPQTLTSFVFTLLRKQRGVPLSFYTKSATVPSIRWKKINPPISTTATTTDDAIISDAEGFP